MAVEYTFIEYMDMHLVICKCWGKSMAAVRQYLEKYQSTKSLNFSLCGQETLETGTVC
jgi:hypothetical protein